MCRSNRTAGALDRGDIRGEEVGDLISTTFHIRIIKHLMRIHMCLGKIVGKNIEELCCKNEGLYNG